MRLALRDSTSRTSAARVGRGFGGSASNRVFALARKASAVSVGSVTRRRSSAKISDFFRTRAGINRSATTLWPQSQIDVIRISTRRKMSSTSVPRQTAAKHMVSSSCRSGGSSAICAERR